MILKYKENRANFIKQAKKLSINKQTQSHTRVPCGLLILLRCHSRWLAVKGEGGGALAPVSATANNNTLLQCCEVNTVNLAVV